MKTHSSSLPLPLQGRVAVITGASSGIGAATAKLLAARGARVALLARRQSLLARQVDEIVAAGGEALALEVDVTYPASIEAAAATIAGKFGVVDLVINNAGVMLPAPILEARVHDWAHMIDLNLTAALQIIATFLPSLVQAAESGRSADLVNISSIAAQNIYPNFAVYSATKAATSHLSRHLRVELGAKNVRVAMIEPGIVNTELQGHFTDQGAKEWIASTRTTIDWLQPADIAETIAFTAALPRHVNLQQVTIMPTRQAT